MMDGHRLNSMYRLSPYESLHRSCGRRDRSQDHRRRRWRISKFHNRANQAMLFLMFTHPGAPPRCAAAYCGDLGVIDILGVAK